MIEHTHVIRFGPAFARIEGDCADPNCVTEAMVDDSRKGDYTRYHALKSEARLAEMDSEKLRSAIAAGETVHYSTRGHHIIKCHGLAHCFFQHDATVGESKA